MLADALWARVQYQQDSIDSTDVKHVLDGGALLHRVLWRSGQTYIGVCNMYVDYVTQKYGKPLIVFDGYQKEDFLSNKENKERFIKLLRERLEAAGCLTEQATGDADLLIVQRSVREQDPAQLYW